MEELCSNELINTLMLGNGFSRKIFKKVPNWRELYHEMHSDTRDISNPTFLYETGLLEGKHADNWYKHRIIEKLIEQTKPENINHTIEGLDQFGVFIKDQGVKEVITTNYDKGIEIVLCTLNGFAYLWPDDVAKDWGEKLYSIRRNVRMKKDNHEVRLWKIHGDIDNISSIALGFDQYCGSLAKMEGYIKGKYKSSSGIECTNPMRTKCINNSFDDYSWIELFFKTNVYIAGFGLDFAEIDIWWLLNKRFRLKKQGVSINNKIVYLYTAFDTGENEKLCHFDYEQRRKMFESKKAILRSFGVESVFIESDNNYLKSLFKQIR